MKSKTIILSKENETGRGILTLYQEEDLLKCRIRLYNINKLNRFCKLGIYHNNEVFSSNLLEKDGVYTSSLVGNFDIDKDFYSAILDTSNNNNVLLSGGTYAGFFFNDTSVFENEIEQVEPNTNLYNYEEENYPCESIETQTSNMCDTMEQCKHCKYKEFFYSNQPQEMEMPVSHSSTITNLNNLEENIQAKQGEITPNILDAIKPQFKYVFENYPADEILNNLITNSKFVKIKENNDQYSIGVIYEQEEIKYICYAVLCDYNSPVPKEIGNNYQWLPLDNLDPLSEGYYVVFQDANDLKIVEL